MRWGLANHTSNRPVMLCPELCAGSKGRFCASVSPQHATAIASLLVCCSSTGSSPLRFMLRGPVLIIIFGDVGDVHPCMCHFVDGAVTVPDPLVGIGIVR